MGKLLWQPSKKQIEQANMTRFINFVNQEYGLKFGSYDALYKWSVENIPDFWAAVWKFLPVKASRSYDKVVDDLTKFPGAQWFPALPTPGSLSRQAAGCWPRLGPGPQRAPP